MYTRSGIGHKLLFAISRLREFSNNIRAHILPPPAPQQRLGHRRCQQYTRANLPLTSQTHKTKRTSRLTQVLLNTSLDPTTAALTFPGGFNSTATTQLLDLTARLYPFNLPENRTDIPRVTSILAAVGLLNSSYTATSPDLNYTVAGLLVNATISQTLQSPSSYDNYGNGWRGLLPSESGDFHSDYINRAYIAWSAYLELQTYEALYPLYVPPDRSSTSPTSNLLSLLANQSLLFTFSAKPPVTAFWSLTAYGQNNFLVPNPLDR